MQYPSMVVRLAALAMGAALAVVSGGGRASAQETRETRARLDQPATGGDAYFSSIYRNFYLTYRLGADDEIAVRVVNQPDYSVERVKVSALGRIYLPLVGDVEVAGMTLSELDEKLRVEFGEYVRSPTLSVDLVTANSSKVGVLGEVVQPGIVVMNRPMTILDAISASGGFTDFGKKSDVTLLRQTGGGQYRTMDVNVKRLLEGKGKPEENVTLQAGDTIVVHGNIKKGLAFISSLAGFGTFTNFVVQGRK